MPLKKLVAESALLLQVLLPSTVLPLLILESNNALAPLLLFLALSVRFQQLGRHLNWKMWSYFGPEVDSFGDSASPPSTETPEDSPVSPLKSRVSHDTDILRSLGGPSRFTVPEYAQNVFDICSETLTPKVFHS
jgi:hypothetical protein